MVEDSGVRELLQKWQAERSMTELLEAQSISRSWLAEAPLAAIPNPRAAAESNRSLGQFEAANPDFLEAMRSYVPDAPAVLLAAAASYWQMVDSLDEASIWWEAGISPLDQRALDYRAAGLTPADLHRRLGPMTVLQHLRRGSAAAWCVARLRRRKDKAA